MEDRMRYEDINPPVEVVRKDTGFFVGDHKLPISTTASLRDVWIAYREYKDWRDNRGTLQGAKMEIFKEFSFDAAHRLPCVPPTHKCSNLHGHTYHVTIHVEGPVGAQNGWVMDFSEIKTAFKPILEQLDHHYLNEIEGLENPTAENIARWIWQRLKPSLPGLCKLIVQETGSSGCVYTGE